MWQAWRERGILPRAGGWEDQPLELLARFAALSLTYDTRVYMKTENSDWSKLTATQREIARWLEGETDEDEEG
jgi:hypothetical protein